MPAPSPYARSYSFSDWTANHPADPQPGVPLDTQFDAVAVAVAALITRLALIQRDDGALKNGVVGADALGSELTMGLRSVRTWATATAFVVNDAAWYGAALYRCIASHTSSVFATDLELEKWELVLDISAIATPLVTSLAAAAVTQEVLDGIELDVDLGPINTALAAKANLAGGNTFTGLQTFASTLNSSQIAGSVANAATAYDYIVLYPTDTTFGKPAFYVHKDTDPLRWEIVVDDLFGQGKLNLRAEEVTVNGDAVLTASDIDNTALETAIRRARHLANAAL